MSGDDTAHSGSSGDETSPPSGAIDAGAGTPGHPWAVGADDPFADAMGDDPFSAEIANVNASDWDFDASRIWGEGAVDDLPG